MKVIQGQCLQGCAMPPTAFMGLTTLSIKIPSLKPIEELDCLHCSRWNYTWWPLLTGKIGGKKFKDMSKKHQYWTILQNQWRTTNYYFHHWLLCPSFAGTKLIDLFVYFHVFQKKLIEELETANVQHFYLKNYSTFIPATTGDMLSTEHRFFSR